MKPEVSVVVPARDAAGILEHCLDALARQHRAPSHEVVVVDNASRDHTRAIAERHPAVTLVVTCERPGSYAARNAGIAASSGQTLAFTDADCMPTPGWLAAGTAATSARQPYVAGPVEILVGDDPTLWARYDRAIYLDQASYVRDLGFAATANLFVHRSLFDDIGVFDPTLVSGGDVELGRRARAQGHEVVFCEDALVHHAARRTARQTWSVHRRVGAGWGELQRRGVWPRVLLDPAMWIPPPTVLRRMARDGLPLRLRRAALVHGVAMLARWVGRFSRRG